MCPTPRKVKVAAIQSVSENSNPAGNLDRAAVLVKQAAAAGAQLVLAPEFLATGYQFHRSIWDAAEPGEQGLTGSWLKSMSRQYRIYLGTSFLDAEGEDFYNTFMLATPDGAIAGKVRKERPACYESFYTRGETGPHIIDTDLGRIAVGVCYENQWSYMPLLAHQHRASLVLQPHSAPTPTKSIFYSEAERIHYNRVLHDLPPSYAKMLGVPVIMSNKCGSWQSPLPGLPLRENSKFPGLSCIADKNGEVIKRLDDTEGFIVAEVTINGQYSSEAHLSPPVCPGKYAVKEHWPTTLWESIEFIGRIVYLASMARRKKARAISVRNAAM